MQYVDPRHKRTEFAADSFRTDADGSARRLSFAGEGQHDSVTLLEKRSAVVAIVPEAEREFVLSKAQILEKQKWLTLDFEENPVLRRILIHIDRLDPDQLDAALRALIGGGSLPYYRRRE